LVRKTQELELGHEMAYQSEGEHKLRLVTLGDQVFETDELDPQGWVSFNRTCPLVDPRNRATRGSCQLRCRLVINRGKPGDGGEKKIYGISMNL